MLELRFKVASERPVDSGGFEEEGRKKKKKSREALNLLELPHSSDEVNRTGPTSDTPTYLLDHLWGRD